MRTIRSSINIKFSHAAATFSRCRQYRYDLTRIWDAARPLACFIMLNPSTADATKLDPTVRRCVGFAASWNCGGLIVLNIFALRSTLPRNLYTHPRPVGPRNDATILRHANSPGISHIVCAWGTHGHLQSRGEKVMKLLAHLPLKHLALTNAGIPKHPLYLRASLQPRLNSRF